MIDTFWKPALKICPAILPSGRVSRSLYRSTMSCRCRLGRFCDPPNTVIFPLLMAWLVRILTDRSKRWRGAKPHSVAGRIVTHTNPGDWCLKRRGSHRPLYLLQCVGGSSGCSSSTSGASDTLYTDLEQA